MLNLSSYELWGTNARLKVPKRVLYSLLYGGVKLAQERIDEEGCGAVFCAARVAC